MKYRQEIARFTNFQVILDARLKMASFHHYHEPTFSKPLFYDLAVSPARRHDFIRKVPLFVKYFIHDDTFQE